MQRYLLTGLLLWGSIASNPAWSQVANSSGAIHVQPKPQTSERSIEDLNMVGAEIEMPPFSDSPISLHSAFRQKLWDEGILLRPVMEQQYAQNLLPAHVSADEQTYVGERPFAGAMMNVTLTADLRQFHLTHAQFMVCGVWNWVSWRPAGPKAFQIYGLYFFKAFAEDRLEIKAGYIGNNFDVMGLAVGGSGATAAQGVYAVLPFEAGLSYFPLTAPSLNVRIREPKNTYLKAVVQRSRGYPAALKRFAQLWFLKEDSGGKSEYKLEKLLSKALIGVGCVSFLLIGGCGGSPSGGSTQQQNPAPILNSIGPNSASAGGPALTLTATGSGFIRFSVVQWNGSPLTTTYGSGTSLTAQVPASDLTAQGTASITVVNPTPGGGTSGAQTFVINAAANPVPVTSSLSPTSANAGSPGLTLTVTGTNFISSSQVQWNGSPLTTTYGSGTSLTAQVPASDLTAQGTASITVVNPTPGGGPSNSLPFDIGAGNHLTEISTPVNHIVWDANHGLLYATLPNTGTNANTVVAINPVTATVGTPVAVGNSPDLLALSTDDSFLYVSLDDTPSIVRFNLPALTLDSSYNLPVPTSPVFGAQTTISMAVAPGSPHTIATIFGQWMTTPPNTGGTFIYDDTTARASSISSYNEESTSLVWGANTSALYATDNTSGADLFVNAVNSTGVTLVEDYGGVMLTQADGALHFHPVSGNVYSDEGHVVDPANGNLVGTFDLGPLYFGVRMG